MIFFFNFRLVIHFDVSELCFKAKAPQNYFGGAFVLLKSLGHYQSIVEVGLGVLVAHPHNAFILIFDYLGKAKLLVKGSGTIILGGHMQVYAFGACCL